MKNKKVKNLILGLLIVCIVGYVYYYYYLSFEIIKINTIKQQIDNRKNTIQQLTQKRQTIDSEIKEIKAQNEKLNDEIPDIYDKKILIAYFYNLIKQYNLSSDRISFSEPEKPEQGCRKVSVNFKVNGDNETIKDFIREIENDKRKFNVKQVNVGQTESGIYSCNLSVEFYSIK